MVKYMHNNTDLLINTAHFILLLWVYADSQEADD